METLKIESREMEAATGFEPVNNGFADRCLTPWLCRLKKMERETGFEPATSTLARSHSTAELFPLNVINYFLKNAAVVKGKIWDFGARLVVIGKNILQYHVVAP